jgi:hypothetical protein
VAPDGRAPGARLALHRISDVVRSSQAWGHWLPLSARWATVPRPVVHLTRSCKGGVLPRSGGPTPATSRGSRLAPASPQRLSGFFFARALAAAVSTAGDGSAPSGAPAPQLQGRRAAEVGRAKPSDEQGVPSGVGLGSAAVAASCSPGHWLPL